MDDTEYFDKNCDMPLYLFHQGTDYNAYDLLGAHVSYDEASSTYTTCFRVWAPGADEVRVTGDLMSWEPGIPMKKISKGVWEGVFRSERSPDGTFYKYAVTRGGVTHNKADPFAFAAETLGRTASVIKSLDGLVFTDDDWIDKRRKCYIGDNDRRREHFYPSPMNIYEIHLGSWKTRDDASTVDGLHYLNYREIADDLADYLVDMGYTHAELLPIMEHPFDGSWGYQVTGYYAPTSRFGTPEDFAYFVDRLHNAGLGVILDWVPAHFPKDEFGLIEFDGAPLFEYQGRDRMEHRGWGTRCFDVGREEVQSFLISNALFWMRKYHVDGLRIDAVASMLYLDYDKAPGEWVPNTDGTNKSYEAIAFFQKLNSAVFAEFPEALMIAEESTSWPMVTKPVSEGGLGFNFKWNMGFANDMFDYVSMDPIYRQYNHMKLTFPMIYAFSENYVLPVSHDEVVHGKRSLVDKMYGEYDEKFSSMRAYLAFMMTMPGKKLLFMGCEFAQIREWDFENSLEWFMLKYPRHTEMQRYVRELNHLYLSRRELWEIEDSWAGFGWVEADRSRDNVVIYNRYDTDGNAVMVIVNFSPVDRMNYKFKTDMPGKYEVLLNSDLYRFGGKNVFPSETLESTVETYETPSGEISEDVMVFDLAANSAMILRRTSAGKRQRVKKSTSGRVPRRRTE